MRRVGGQTHRWPTLPEPRVGARSSRAFRIICCRTDQLQPCRPVQAVCLCIAGLIADVLICRVADSKWRPGRVYFLTLLEPLARTTGLWPLPSGRPVCQDK